MKILHVWDTAGVASLLAREQRRLGHEVRVIMSENLFATFGISEFYNAEMHEGTKLSFTKHLYPIIKKWKPDIVHVHGQWKLILFIRLFYSGKIVLHLHGTDARKDYGRVKNAFRKLAYKFSDFIILATEDLLHHVQLPNCMYIPNPVDTIHFAKRNIPNNSQWYSDRRYSGNENLKVQYKDLPDVMSKFEWFRDAEKFKGQRVMSKTALEALSLGLKVEKANGEIAIGLPREHEPEQVNKKIMLIYDDLLYNIYNDWLWMDKNI